MRGACRLVPTRWFENTAVILFLNKMDLFAEKIKIKDLRQPNPVAGEPELFSSYTGGVQCALLGLCRPGLLSAWAR